MSLELITAPTVEPITTAEAKTYGRIDRSDHDDLIASLITSARLWLDGESGWLGRSLVTETWRWKFDAFPVRDDDALIVPRPPLQSVSSISYVDTAGDSQTWSSASYTVDTASEPGRIYPVYAGEYPSTRDQRHAVTVTFVAGYPGDGNSPEDLRANIPAPIKTAIKALVLHWYDNPGAVSDSLSEIPMGVQSLLAPFRIWSV